MGRIFRTSVRRARDNGSYPTLRISRPRPSSLSHEDGPTADLPGIAIVEAGRCHARSPRKTGRPEGAGRVGRTDRASCKERPRIPGNVAAPRSLFVWGDSRTRMPAAQSRVDRGDGLEGRWMTMEEDREVAIGRKVRVDG